jgi:SAM-dependent methyltransferase
VNSLLEAVRRAAAAPSERPAKIPWGDPAFSKRMLHEHLSQEHDMASRRSETIDDHVAWIRGKLLPGDGTRVLDLGCGPGLYTARMARVGHECVGIDFSPASIEYAEKQAAAKNLACEYRREDVLKAEFGGPFDLVMMLSGEFNTFNHASASAIVGKAFEALEPGGPLLLEVSPMDAVRRLGRRPPVWWTQDVGVFSPEPHLVLRSQAWDDEALIASSDFFVVDASTTEASRYGEEIHAFSDEQLLQMLKDGGFRDAEIDWSFPAAESETKNEMMAVVARKGT